MKKTLTSAFITTLLCCGSPVVYADNVTDLIKSVEKNYLSHKYSKALEDLEWVRKEISNQHLKSMSSFFPDEIDGMTGKDVDAGAAMGVRGVSKLYAGDDREHSITISLISGGNAPVGNGLSALMSMASSLEMMGGGSHSKVVVQKGYRGQFIQQSGERTGTLTFNLSGGKMIIIETIGYTGSAEAEKVAKQLDIAKIEEAF
ncbi:MAG: hypothetical protein CSA49_01975 [Gammaproteobacteria bacterium]|nr:MAG: hypothetical protein CSA49_01975 [Gammaproteobacteria bacterium]